MSDDAAEQVDIRAAQANFSRIIERVEHGEEIVISRAGIPVARIVPPDRRVDRQGRGSLRDTLIMTEDWNSDEVNEAVTDDWR